MPLSNASPSHKSSPKQEAKQERFLTVSTNLDNPPYKRPTIRIRGRWLADAGFPPETRVRIQVSKNRLVLTPMRYAANDESERMELRVLEVLAKYGALHRAALCAALGKVEEAGQWKRVIRKLTVERKIAYPIVTPMQNHSPKYFLTELGCATLAACIEG
jgi:hypothetical protein